MIVAALIPETVLGTARFGLGDQLPKGGFPAPWKEDLTDGPVGCLDHGHRHPEGLDDR
jgi:hypothetical protein